MVNRKTGKVRRAPAQPVVRGIPASYPVLLADIKDRVQRARTKAGLSVNAELISLYWHIGGEIRKRQEEEGWGDKVIERLALDLHKSFPEMSGFSRANLFYMRQFHQTYAGDSRIVQQLVGQIPWGHNLAIMGRVKDAAQRRFYLEQTVSHGWSRAVLVHQIESGLHRRKGRAVTNFAKTLPKPQSDLARQTLKDPYLFEFMTLADDAAEKDLERGLTEHVRDFLLELGVGFAFVGNQVPIEVGKEDYYIDLLFYHVHLHCYVVIDLKVGEFKPEHAGKMSFYLAAVDDLIRGPDDQPTIGLILCRSKKKVIAEYALRGFNAPMGVADWKTRLKLVESLPKNLKGRLPTVKQLEKGMAKAGKIIDV